VVIPARGGSKGIPRKNIKELCGKPLIYYTIEEARKIFDNEVICVSTDDEEIKEIVEKTGLEVPFLRPKELATDTAETYGVLLHALEYYEDRGCKTDLLTLLQPTSPFRKAEHIKKALELYKKSLDMVVSVKKTDANPYYVLYEENSKGYLESSKKGDFTRRQDCPEVYEVNGAVYVMNVESLKECSPKRFKRVKKMIMDRESSIDIDTPLDWKIAECLMKNKDNL
jgi:N-acylneuraminate cytidylyltransferase